MVFFLEEDVYLFFFAFKPPVCVYVQYRLTYQTTYGTQVVIEKLLTPPLYRTVVGFFFLLTVYYTHFPVMLDI